MPSDALRHRLELPAAVLDTLVDEAGLAFVDGRITQPGKAKPSLPPAVEQAVRAVEADLRTAPYVAPDANRLAELGLGTRELAAAVRSGRLDAIADGLVLLPGAVEQAPLRLTELPQPFTLSQAKQALGTTRRVAVPLLELLDRRGVTERLPDGTRRLSTNRLSTNRLSRAGDTGRRIPR
jgi:selenocysteine-specific elongation factor